MASFVELTPEVSLVEERSSEVHNRENSLDRWHNAILYYQKTCRTVKRSRTREKCRCTAVIDTSGSMEGKKIIAVKLGLCSLIANLDGEDEVHISAFSSVCQPLSDGFCKVAELVTQLPRILTSIQTDGSTAFFDAIIQGLKCQKARSDSVDHDSEQTKNVLLVLTDGEDNQSASNANIVEQFLIRPGVPTFMFVLVAVAMTGRQELAFSDWLELTHCKQIRFRLAFFIFIFSSV